MGVRRAVETVLDTIRKEDHAIATFGPLIHNPQVLELLAKRGVTVLKELPERASGTIVIRAHGIPPAHKQSLRASGARIVDATCPRVIKVQAIIKRFRKEGCSVIIVGDKNHAEVEGLMGYAGPLGIVVSNESEIDHLELRMPYIIVSQTTQDEAGFVRMTEKILARFPGGRVFDTICNSTHKRQEEVRRLCERAQAVVVVGGRSSANTRRLGEIAESMGRPVFMVETEEDLDLAALEKFGCVGVTAGASTPTWLINRVVNSLESIRSRSEGAMGQMVYRMVRILLETNLYVSVGGGSLAYVCALLQGMAPSLAHFVTAFGYLFAMHNFNRFTGQESEKFNDPVRARFYRNYRWPLLLSSLVALVAALAIAYASGPRVFLFLLAMSVLGTLYSVHVIPKPLRPILGIRGLKEIPGSKTLFVATAWAVVVTILPMWESDRNPGTTTLATFFVVLLLVYIRSAFFDVLDVQGDRIVGKETLPVLIGEKKTLSLLHWLLGILAGLLLLLPVAGWLSSLAFWLVPGCVYLGAVIVFYEKGYLIKGQRLEFAAETLFCLFAALAWLGSRPSF